MIELEQSLVAGSTAQRKMILSLPPHSLWLAGIEQFKNIATRLPEIKRYFTHPSTNKLFFSPVLRVYLITEKEQFNSIYKFHN